MIRHSLPGFLAGPMPVPGWPKDNCDDLIEKFAQDIGKSFDALHQIFCASFKRGNTKKRWAKEIVFTSSELPRRKQ